MPYPERPILREEEGCYVLYIHPKDRLRAKRIGQCRFDPQRSGWIYPRDARIVDALIAEFGDELDLQAGKAEEASPRLRPAPPTRVPEHVESAQGATTPASRTIDIEEYVELRVKSEKLEEQLKSALLDLEMARNTAKKVQAALETRNAGETLDRLAKEVAVEAAAHDQEFASLLERVEIRDMPIALARRLEEECRRLLRVSDERISFADLLSEVKDSNLLPADVIDLAHIIRKQRNIVAHEDTARCQKNARAVLTLMSASLLWHDLKRSQADSGS